MSEGSALDEMITGTIRTLHITSGVAMVGGVLIWVLLLVPLFQKKLAPHVADIVFKAVDKRVNRYLDVAGAVALVSGVLLLGRIYGISNVWTVLTGGSLYGSLLLGGLVMLILTYVAVYAYIEPVLKRLDKLMATAGEGEPPPAARRALAHVAVGNFAVVALSIGILIVMAAAVNVRT